MKSLILVLVFIVNTSLVFAQWVQQTTLPQVNSLNDIKFINKYLGFAVGNAGTLIKTTDGGNTWLYLNSGYEKDLNSISFVDSNNGFVGGNDILNTKDGGKTWSFYSIGQGNEIHSLYMVDSLYGYAVGEYALVLKTIDGGKTWVKTSNATPYVLYSVYFFNRDTGCVACSDGIYLTTNGGKNWQKSANAIDGYFYSFSFLDSKIGYAIGVRGLIYMTTNGGQNWDAIKNMNEQLNYITFINRKTAYIFGNNGAIYKTEDACNSWRKFYGIKCGNFTSAYFTDSITGYAIDGKILIKTINGGGPVDTTYIKPKLELSSKATYFNCEFALVSAHFTVDTLFPDDSICWVYDNGKNWGYSPNYSIQGGFDNATGFSLPNYDPGTYGITLNYKRRGKVTTIRKDNVFTLRQLPKAFFDIDVKNTDSIYAPATINFINETPKGEMDTMIYTWEFPDGTISYEKDPIHTFNNPKTYFVSLNVKDSYGCEGNYAKEIIVKDTAQRNEINYIVGSCSDNVIPPCGWDKHFIIQNDTLKIYGFTGGNCCTKKTATVTNRNDTIYIRTFEIGQGCTCSCGFCFAINVPNISKDSVNVSFNGLLFTAKKTYNSIRVNPFQNEIKIYPNPVISGFTIDYSSLNQNNYQIEMLNMLGQIVYKDMLVNTTKLKVNVDNLKSGFYLIRTFGDKTSIYMNKIIINKAP